MKPRVGCFGMCLPPMLPSQNRMDPSKESYPCRWSRDACSRWSIWPRLTHTGPAWTGCSLEFEQSTLYERDSSHLPNLVFKSSLRVARDCWLAIHLLSDNPFHLLGSLKSRGFRQPQFRSCQIAKLDLYHLHGKTLDKVCRHLGACLVEIEISQKDFLARWLPSQAIRSRLLDELWYLALHLVSLIWCFVIWNLCSQIAWPKHSKQSLSVRSAIQC